MKRVNLNFDEDLLEKIDTYAKKLGVNRSATISMLCSEYLDQKEALVAIQALTKVAEMQQTMQDNSKQ